MTYQDDYLTTEGVPNSLSYQGRADRADLLNGFVHGHQHGERLPNASSAAIDTHLAKNAIKTTSTGRSLRDVEKFPHNHWLKIWSFPKSWGDPRKIIHEIDFPVRIFHCKSSSYWVSPICGNPPDVPPKSVGQSTQVVHLELGCAEGCSWSIAGEERSGTLEAPG